MILNTIPYKFLDVSHPVCRAKILSVKKFMNKVKLPRQPKGTYPPPQNLEDFFPLVTYWAGRYNYEGIEFEELINAGKFGLVKAAEKFDGSTKFSYYCGIHIKKYLNLYVKETFNKNKHEVSCAINEEIYQEFVDLRAEKGIWNRLHRLDIEKICAGAKLTKTEKLVIFHHYGINTTSKSFKSIGFIIGKSYEWARQLEGQAMKKMKKYLQSNKNKV